MSSKIVMLLYGWLRFVSKVVITDISMMRLLRTFSLSVLCLQQDEYDVTGIASKRAS